MSGGTEAIAERGFDSVEDYQRWHHLELTGVVDRVTERSLNAPRFCGLPDRMEQAGRVCLWGKRKLVCSWNGQLDGISNAAAIEALDKAWSAWEAVCGLTVDVVSGAKDADIIVV
jgi:hypothetical protein